MRLGWIYLGEAWIPHRVDVFLDHVILRLQAPGNRSRGKKKITLSSIAREYGLPWYTIHGLFQALGLTVQEVMAGEEL